MLKLELTTLAQAVCVLIPVYRLSTIAQKKITVSFTDSFEQFPAYG